MGRLDMRQQVLKSILNEILTVVRREIKTRVLACSTTVLLQKLNKYSVKFKKKLHRVRERLDQ